ncbi:MAG: ClbS/DfsB family four-helix bundle protein [Pseudomonadota bacterium]
MPSAVSQEDLVAITKRDYRKLKDLIGGISASTAMTKDEDDTSIKDVIAHRAHWIDLFFGWYTDGLEEKEVHFPAKGYKWNQLKAYNADLRQRQKNLTWAKAKAYLDEAHRRLLAFMEQASDDDLFSGPMKGANNRWTPGRWAEAAGPSHYRSAAKYIRSRLRALNTQPPS